MKRYVPAIILGLGIIGVVVSIALSTPSVSKPLPPVAPTPSPYVGEGFRGVDLNTATSGAIMSIMGNPLRVEAWKNQKALIYTSGTEKRLIKIVTDANNSVDYVIEPAQPGTRLGVLLTALGKEDVVLYGSYYHSGYYLYTYLTRGTAILANPTTDDVKRRWYFSPRSLSGFLRTAGAGFQTSPLPSGAE